MPTFIMTSRHSPENCPLINENARKMTLEITAKMPELTKKHGVKVTGSWSIIPEHLIIQVFEVPSFEAFLKFSMEPAIMKWIANNTSEIKPAMTTEESIKLFK